MVIKKSFNAVNKVFIFVIFYYLLFLSSAIFSAINRVLKFSLSMLMLLLGLELITIMTQYGVMGAISKVTAGEGVTLKSWIEGIKSSFFRYLGAIIVLGIFYLILLVIFVTSTYLMFSGMKGMAVNEIIETVPFNFAVSLSIVMLTIFSIYIIPFVFVKNKGADAVIDGIKYLFKNFKNSIVLIVMGIVKTFLYIYLLLFASNYSHYSFQYNAITSLNSFISIYIDLIVFAGACYILRDELACPA